MSKLIPALAVSLCAATFAADTIALKTGAAIEGQIIRDTPGDPLIAINTGGKLILLNRDEIRAITLDEEGRSEFQRRRDALKDTNAAGHFELYKWAKSQRLFDYADQQLSATLKADPTHADARKVVYAAATLSKQVAAAEKAALAAPAVAIDEPTIRVRAGHPAASRPPYDEKILMLCKALMPTVATDDPARTNALKALNADRIKASDVVVNYLDPAKTSDEQIRLAALAGIDALKPVSPDVSKRLAQSAIFDPSQPVRKHTIALIKSRNDEWAMDTMVNTYISAFNEGGAVRDPILKEAAGAALRDLDDKRVFSSMYYRATLEIRTEVSELNNLTTRQIDSFSVQNTQPIPTVFNLSFPIQFPELKITKVNTTVCAPCAALSDLSGQNFGNDLDLWAKWMRKNK